MKNLLAALCALVLCSCATVVRGTSDTAEFESSPSGADVKTESISEDKMGPFSCVTPCQLELKRKRTWRVDFALEGYKPVSGLLKPVVTGGGVAAGAGNALIGGLIGVGIDAGTGANMDLRPNPMVAELEPIDSPRASRILDAEIVTGVEEAPADEQAPADEKAPADAGAPTPIDEDVEIDDPSDENAAEPDDASEVEPAAVPLVQNSSPDKAAEGNAAATLQRADYPAGDAEKVAVQSNSESRGLSDRSEVRIYRPGEPAPDDEVSGDLNRQQLEKVRSVVGDGDNPS